MDKDYYTEFNNSDVKAVVEEFKEYMGNDFNTANAITAIFKVTKLLNNYLREREVKYEALLEGLQALKSMLWVLGVNVDVAPLSEEDKDLVNKWNQAKAVKDFETADKLRLEITSKNIVL